jgi:hypothetical protein
MEEQQLIKELLSALDKEMAPMILEGDLPGLRRLAMEKGASFGKLKGKFAEELPDLIKAHVESESTRAQTWVEQMRGAQDDAKPLTLGVAGLNTPKVSPQAAPESAGPVSLLDRMREAGLMDDEAPAKGSAVPTAGMSPQEIADVLATLDEEKAPMILEDNLPRLAIEKGINFGPLKEAEELELQPGKRVAKKAARAAREKAKAEEAGLNKFAEIQEAADARTTETLAVLDAELVELEGAGLKLAMERGVEFSALKKKGGKKDLPDDKVPLGQNVPLVCVRAAQLNCRIIFL